MVYNMMGIEKKTFCFLHEKVLYAYIGLFCVSFYA